jgi:hypothetical protein
MQNNNGRRALARKKIKKKHSDDCDRVCTVHVKETKIECEMLSVHNKLLAIWDETHFDENEDLCSEKEYGNS